MVRCATLFAMLHSHCALDHTIFPLTLSYNIYKVHPVNNLYEQEIRYRLLKILSQESKQTQRDMAKKVGISLGKVNYCLSELAKKGLIKIIRFKSARDKRPYTYILTPRGIEEKAKLTVTFLRRKISEYKEIRRQISELTLEIDEEKLRKISEAETLDVMRNIP